MRARVFIGSSTEGLPIAQQLQAYLEDDRNYLIEGESAGNRPDVRLWTEDPIFRVAESIQQSLIRATQEFDFAAMIFSADDSVVSRDNECPGPRDNVVFEAGLFAGVLGFDRVYVVTPHGIHLKIASDLAGLNRTTYSKREDGSFNVNTAGRGIIAAIRDHGIIRHERIEPKIRTLVSQARSAYKIQHELFHGYLERWCDRSLEEASCWPEGTLTIDIGTGNWLATLFKQAKRNIFSTSIPAYMKIWQSGVGRQILNAQRPHELSCTRVFVFDKRSHVTSEAIEIMKIHSSHGVHVRTFYDDEIAEFEWDPGNIDTDFTFIDDGDIIGVTERMQGRYRSKWFFSNPMKKRQYDGYRESLMDFSEPFDA